MDKPHLLSCSLCDGCLSALSFLGLPLPLLLVKLLGQLHLNHWHSRLGLGGRHFGLGCISAPASEAAGMSAAAGSWLTAASLLRQGLSCIAGAASHAASVCEWQCQALDVGDYV